MIQVSEVEGFPCPHLMFRPPVRIDRRPDLIHQPDLLAFVRVSQNHRSENEPPGTACLKCEAFVAGFVNVGNECWWHPTPLGAFGEAG